MENKRIKIGLALGGGAALGFAHIGVLKVLEEHNIKIDYITGTSMGSIIGALYASGLTPDELLNFSKNISFGDIARINGLKVLKDGIFTTEKLNHYFEKILKNRKIENTRIPFSCIATDLVSGEPYVFNKGDIIEAMRASSAMSGIFSPVYKEDKILVDGGVLKNIPYELALDMGSDFVIAINLDARYKKYGKLKSIDKILISTIRLMLHEKDKSDLKNFPKDHGYLLNVNSSNDEYDYSQKAITDAYELGVKTAEQNIDKIIEKINKFKQARSENEKEILMI